MTEPSAHDPARADTTHLDGLCILLVEDSWHVAMAMKGLLRAWGADVVGPVATGAEASRLVSERVPDVALVDVNLRGGELAYGLIDQLLGQGILVIVTSGYADLPLAEGKDVVILQKPINEAKLLECLRPLIRQKAAL